MKESFQRMLKTEKNDLKIIKQKIEELLVHPIKQERLLDKYNEIKKTDYKYKNYLQSPLSVKEPERSKSRKKSITTKSPTFIQTKNKNISENTAKNTTIRHPTAINKEVKTETSQKKPKLSIRIPESPSESATRLDKIKKRYVELVHKVSLVTQDKPPTPTSNPAIRMSQQDRKTVKNQLLKQLQNYIAALKSENNSMQKRQQILNYVEEIMDKVEYIIF